MENDIVAQFQREQLHRAAEAGDLLLIRDLINRKYPINRFDELGKTPLHYAVEADRIDVVKLLLGSGANVNAHDERLLGNTPLSDNIGHCTYEMAKLLIDAGADPTIRGWMRLNAIDRAGSRKDTNAREIVKLLEQSASRYHN